MSDIEELVRRAKDEILAIQETIRQQQTEIDRKDAAINAMLKVAYSLHPTTEAEQVLRNKEVHDATEGLKQALHTKG